MPGESELNDMIEAGYHRVMQDGTVAAILREGIKDIRATLMESFFGKGERGGDLGTPLNPLFSDIVADRNSHNGPYGPAQQETTSMDADHPLPTPSQVIANPETYLPQGPSQEQGHAMTVEAAAERAEGPLPSPSQVIASPHDYLTDQQRGPVQQLEHTHEM